MKRIAGALALLTILLAVMALGAVFPSSVATDADLLVARNSATSTLNGAINNSVTTFSVVSGTRFGNNMVVTIDSEIIFCTTLSTATFSGCSRGYNGTIAASHSNGATVSGFLIAAHHNALSDEIKAIETALGANLSNLFSCTSTPITCTIYDSTPSTGRTTLDVKAGAGQSTNPLARFYNSAGTLISEIGADGSFGNRVSTVRKVILFGGITGYSSDVGTCWANNSDWDLGTIDLCAVRDATGVLQINNGTAGTYRDLKLRQLYTGTNCSDSAGAAACGSAAAGAFVVDAAATSTVVSTTAVTANSEITVTFDASLGTRLGITCNAAVPPTFYVSARTAGTSFTLTSSAPVTNPACFAYQIVN